jgi:CheY-like chemotaxis protein
MAQSLVAEQIKVHCELAEGLPPIYADPSNLEQVLINLIVNARDAMPDGGLLTIRSAPCEVSAEEAGSNPDARAGSFACLSVADTGCGIDAAMLNRIFEPFFTTKPMGKGTGMGLAMVYGIVKQHQGWITVSSQLGKGSVFRIFLPLSKEPIMAAAEKTPDPQDPRGNETILIVEDDRALRAITATMLSAAGYRVLEATSGVDALRVWYSEDEKIDLLLSDIIMPEGMTGRKLAEKLRVRKPDLKVMLMSGHDSELEDKDAGVPDAQFVAKPYSTAIVAAVRSCLDKCAVAC